jgi:hypothetical protein
MTATSLIAPYHASPAMEAEILERYLLELTAKEVQPGRFQQLKAACNRMVRHSDTLFVRIALPPLALWAVLYSLVEYIA